MSMSTNRAALFHRLLRAARVFVELDAADGHALAGQHTDRHLFAALRGVLRGNEIGHDAAYRRTVLIQLEPILEDRNILGVPIKYGETVFCGDRVQLVVAMEDAK